MITFPTHLRKANIYSNELSHTKSGSCTCGSLRFESASCKQGLLALAWGVVVHKMGYDEYLDVDDDGIQEIWSKLFLNSLKTLTSLKTCWRNFSSGISLDICHWLRNPSNSSFATTNPKYICDDHDAADKRLRAQLECDECKTRNQLQTNCVRIRWSESLLWALKLNRIFSVSWILNGINSFVYVNLIAFVGKAVRWGVPKVNSSIKGSHLEIMLI